MGVLFFVITFCIVFICLDKKNKKQTAGKRRESLIKAIFNDNSTRVNFCISVASGVVSGLLVVLVTNAVNGGFLNYKERNPNINISDEVEMFMTCDLENGETCYYFDVLDESLIPFFTIDIQNNSEKAIYFDDSDAMSIELKEYIPFDDLNIVDTFGGGDGWNEPMDFEINLSDELGEQYAIPIVNGEPKAINDSFISVDKNTMNRFRLKILPRVKGYYRCAINLNYTYNNKKYSWQTKDYGLVCYRGLDELLTERPEKASEHIDGNNEQGKYDEALNKETLHGSWLLSSETHYTKRGYIQSWVDYIYDDMSRLQEEIHYRDNGEVNWYTAYSYDENGNVINSSERWKDGSEHNNITYRYDKNGNLCNEIYHDLYITYEYDEFGNLVKESYLDSYNTLHYYTYTYAYGGRLIESAHRQPGSGDDSVTTYTYNENGQVVSMDTFNEDATRSHTEISYMNNLKVKEVYENGYNSYKYDEKGNLILEASYDDSGSLKRSTGYEYDLYGNKIKTIYDNGSYILYGYKNQ